MMMVHAVHLLSQLLLTFLYWKIFPCDLGDLLSTRSEYILLLIQYAPFCEMGNKRPPLPNGCSHQACTADPYFQASCCGLTTTLLRVWSLLSGLAAATLHSAQLTSLLMTL